MCHIPVDIEILNNVLLNFVFAAAVRTRSPAARTTPFQAWRPPTASTRPAAAETRPEFKTGSEATPEPEFLSLPEALRERLR